MARLLLRGGSFNHLCRRRRSLMHRETEGSVKPTVPSPSQDASARDHLDSWKAIASYLDRTVRTVQRWEKKERLPVRRHCHLKGNSVHSSKQEIDEWQKSRSLATGSQLLQATPLGLVTEIDSAQREALRSPGAEPCAVFILYCIAGAPFSSDDSQLHRVGLSERSSLTRSTPDGPAPCTRVSLQLASPQKGE